MEVEPQGQFDAGEDSGDFLEMPALHMAARAIAQDESALIGKQIGPFRIVKFIAAGGMGEVFLAEDMRLRRNVAVKFLRPELAKDADRVSRFAKEARAASALNHPNVLVIYDVGLHAGLPYIASEYLEGETLRQRLGARRLAAPKAVDFAVQVARALAAAHENGIVHRDLKPENLLITREERVKVLDFGLAKLIDSPANKFAGADATAAVSVAGLIMGTPGYLSPEQIRGQPIDHRSDLFALGAILYEMLTGRRAFSGDSTADLIRSTLAEQGPDCGEDQIAPPALSRIVERCLQKSPVDRFQSASDLAFALETLTWTPSQTAPRKSRLPFGISEKHVAWILALALTAAVLTVAALSLRRTPADRNLERFEMTLPGADPAVGGPAISLSPDGKYLAFLSTDSNNEGTLWVRSLDSVMPTLVPGTQGARFPFWSPDSRFLAFQADNKLRTVDVTTGAQRTICKLHGIVSGAWSADNTIVAGVGSGPLLRISLDGEQHPLTRFDSSQGQRSHWWPCFLPDNRHFLYTVHAGTPEEGGVFIGSLDSSESHLLLPSVISSASFVAPGYLLYVREGTLMAHSFDARRLVFNGDEIPIVEHLKSYYGYSVFSASQTGTLAYRTGSQARYRLSWFDRTGAKSAVVGSASGNKWWEGILPLSPSLSPDGKLVTAVVYRAPRGSYDIWAADLSRANLAFQVTNTSNAEAAVWSPDGSRIAYSASPKGGARDLFAKGVNEPGAGDLLLHSTEDKWPLSWSTDGRTILFRATNAQSHSILLALPLTGPASPRQLTSASINVEDGCLSPDGHWLSYSSKQSGTYAVFVQDFPAGKRRTVISIAGGRYPYWRQDGKELFYLSLENELMSMSIQTGVAPLFGLPRTLFKTGAVGANPYTVTPDGKHFLVQTGVDNAIATPIVFVLNWPQMMKR